MRPCLPCYTLHNGSKSGWNRGEQSRFNLFIPKGETLSHMLYTLENSSLKHRITERSFAIIQHQHYNHHHQSNRKVIFSHYIMLLLEQEPRSWKFACGLSQLTTDRKDTKFCIVRAACSDDRFTLYYFKRAWIPDLCCQNYKWSIVN